jgi:magnesium-protoporphyrin O-methyltransferase
MRESAAGSLRLPEQWARRSRAIEHYFDRTAVQAWTRLMSDAPVGRIRATVRAGRDQMRATLLAALPQDLAGWRILDAGCGTGMLSVELARRGATVLAVDLSPTLVDLGRKRYAELPGQGCIEFQSGDFLDPALGSFDAVVAMDSLIHYPFVDVVQAVQTLADRTRKTIVFTFAPRTALLATMHAVGRLFPRGDRSPAIEPVAARTLSAALARSAALANWQWQPTQRVNCGFYISEAAVLRREG